MGQDGRWDEWDGGAWVRSGQQVWVAWASQATARPIAFILNRKGSLWGFEAERSCALAWFQRVPLAVALRVDCREARADTETSQGLLY